MKKAELINEIVIVLNWTLESNNKEKYHDKVLSALGNVNWYLSNELMTRVLMKIKKEELIKIHHDVIEAIY